MFSTFSLAIEIGPSAAAVQNLFLFCLPDLFPRVRATRWTDAGEAFANGLFEKYYRYVATTPALG